MASIPTMQSLPTSTSEDKAETKGTSGKSMFGKGNTASMDEMEERKDVRS